MESSRGNLMTLLNEPTELDRDAPRLGRRFRFGVRTLLLVMTLACIVMSIPGMSYVLGSVLGAIVGGTLVLGPLIAIQVAIIWLIPPLRRRFFRKNVGSNSTDHFQSNSQYTLCCEQIHSMRSMKTIIPKKSHIVASLEHYSSFLCDFATLRETPSAHHPRDCRMTRYSVSARSNGMLVSRGT